MIRTNNGWPQYYLTCNKWLQLCTLDYILIWGFGNYENNMNLYNQLTSLRHTGIEPQLASSNGTGKD